MLKYCLHGGWVHFKTLKYDKNGSLFHELFHLLSKITESNIEFVVNLLYDFWRLDLYFAV